MADGLQPGVIDLAFPVIGPFGHSVAALTVPYVATTYSVLDLATVRRHAAQAAGRSGWSWRRSHRNDRR
ncbi:hypothetical protein [Mesorhizobium sp. B2-4-14]|uniref:hypothetical protein n=1 Tax=Mesorhizobium sp. B2-4-14 TaxID=2589935 RepID=UPI0015E45826|nr:hypothetical protein [Mesorhizobium sp. B2-4-14]